MAEFFQKTRELRPELEFQTDMIRRMPLYEIKICLLRIDNKTNIGGGGGSRTRVRKCYWSGDYMLIRVHALGITRRRSRGALRTDKKRVPLACGLSFPSQT